MFRSVRALPFLTLAVWKLHTPTNEENYLS